MFEDEGFVKPTPPTRVVVAQPVLDSWGVGELQGYVRLLHEEIARAEARIAAKQSHRTNADALFRTPPPRET